MITVISNRLPTTPPTTSGMTSSDADVVMACGVDELAIGEPECGINLIFIILIDDF